MSINIQEFVKSQSKLVAKKNSTRVAKLDLAGKYVRGKTILHFIPDSNGLPMLTTKGVFEVHQTETYTYQDEERIRYTTQVIPNSSNYNNVQGAVKPTEMQFKKLDKLYGLLSTYQELTNSYQDGGAKLDSSVTETKMWLKYIPTYTKFWAKVNSIVPSTPNPNGKTPDTSKVVMCTHNSTNFVKAFNKWGSVDEELDISVEDQINRINSTFSNDVTEQASCVKITTEKAAVGFDVTMVNVKLDKHSVEITEDDLKEVTPLITEDWDYTVFDDEKVDTLISRLETALSLYEESDEESEENEEVYEENSDEDEEETSENPFDDDDDEE
jgi:hypothetical protein